MPTHKRARRFSGNQFAAAAIGIGLATLSACDFEVVNPGPVADEFLSDPAAFAGVVGGIARTLGPAWSGQATDAGIRTREMHGTGPQWWYNSLESHIGTPRALNRGGPWGDLQRARWMGEDAIRRFGEVLDPAAFERDRHVALAHMWTGYANRILGEYYCEATFDSGPKLPGDEFFRQAEALFTRAIAVATAAGDPQLALAGHAARAGIRVDLGDWDGALDDARLVPTDLEFRLPFHSNSVWQDQNGFFEDDGRLTIWNTYYEQYYTETADPRTAWVVGDPATISSGFPEWDRMPRLHQRKYPSGATHGRLSSGAEMRLIEAEDHLRQGRIDPAMEILASLRARAGVAPWPDPATLQEAWTLLKRERGIELWLEGRRLFDFRRWQDDQTPGALSAWELGGGSLGPDRRNMALCMPIPQSEIDTNPNF